MSSRPALGSMIYWRFKRDAPSRWLFGYVTDAGSGLIRMGWWNGDNMNGTIVSPSEIEWKKR